MFSSFRFLATISLFAAAATAQRIPDAAGHWSGEVNVPKHESTLTVDLARDAKGHWIGTISMPDSRTLDIPLGQILVDGYSVRFVVAGAPNNPSFEGVLSPDGHAFTGTYTLGEDKYPFALERKGAAQVALPPPSTPIGREFEGSWEGVLVNDDERLRVVVKLERGPDGAATGTLTSLDQDNIELPLTTVTQKSRRLLFEIRTIGASFSGAINAAGTEISGDWAQPSGALPLVLKKVK